MQNVNKSKALFFAVSLVFVLSFLLSTGAFVDILILGVEGRFTKASDDGGYRFMLWFPLYLVMALFVVFRSKSILLLFRYYPVALALLFYIVLSAIWSASPFVTLYSAMQLILISLFAVACSSLFSIKYLFNLIYMVFSFIILSSFVFVVFFPDYGVDLYNGESAFRGVFVEKNKLGQILTYYFLLSVFFVKLRLLPIGVFIIAVFLLAGNKSMTALLLTLSIPCVLLFSRYYIGNKSNIYINSVAISVLFLLFFSVFLVNYYDILNFLGKDPTLTGRTDIWELGYYAFIDSPFLGYGYNSFWSSSALYGGEFIQWVLFWGPTSMHNGWFEILLQLGGIGFVLFMVFFLSVFKLSIFYLNSADLKSFGKVLFVFFAMMFFWSLMQHNLFRHQAFTHYMFYVFFSATFFYKHNLSISAVQD